MVVFLSDDGPESKAIEEFLRREAVVFQKTAHAPVPFGPPYPAIVIHGRVFRGVARIKDAVLHSLLF